MAPASRDQPASGVSPVWLMLLIPLVISSAVVAASRLACVSGDGVHFLRFARQLGEDPVFYMKAHLSQPGFSAMILGLHGLIGQWLGDHPADAWLRAGQIVSAAGYVACAPLLWLLSARLFDRRSAALAALLVVFWPQAHQLGGDVLSDMPHLAVYLASVFLCCQAVSAIRRDDDGEKPRIGRAIWIRLVTGGVLAAAAYLIRQEAMGIPVAATLWLCWPKRGRSVRWHRVAVAAGALWLAFLVPLLPYVAVTGRLMHKKSIGDLLMGPASQAVGDSGAKRRSDEATERRRGEKAATLSVDNSNSLLGFRGTSLTAHRGRQRNPASAVQGDDPHARAAVTGAPAAALAPAPLQIVDGWAKSGRYVYSALALFALLWRRVPRAAADPTRFILLLLVVHCIAVYLRSRSFEVISTRYLLVPAGLTIPWAAAGLLAMLERVRERYGGAGAAGTLGAVCVIMSVLGPKSINDSQRYLRDAAMWLRVNAAATDRVLADRRLSQVVYYSGLTWDEWPEAPWTYEQLLERDAATPARWYVHLIGGRPPSSEDEERIGRVLAEPRWPRAREAYRGASTAKSPPAGGSAVRLVVIVELRR